MRVSSVILTHDCSRYTLVGITLDTLSVAQALHSNAFTFK